MITSYRNYQVQRNSRRGAALLFCMFILTLTVLMVVNVLDSTTLELSALRNSIDHERALYLANAALHHAAATLEADTAWRGIIIDGAYPADNTYTAEAVDGAGSTVTVTASGVAGDVVRNLEATIEL
jgi:type II secretory pathway component PulK